MKLRKLCALGLLSGLALIIFLLEQRLPALLPIPGVKPGLSNIVILATLYRYDRRSAGAVLAVKLLLGAAFAGNPSALLYAVSGGVLSYGAACLLRGCFPRRQLWFLSAVSALCHNLGQLLAARLVTDTAGIWWYAPVLALSGLLTGVFTGLCAAFVLARLDGKG